MSPSVKIANPRNRKLLLTSYFLTSLLCFNLCAEPTAARMADDFVEAQGVCLHVQNFSDQQWPKVKKHLGDLGIRYYRDGLEHTDNPVFLARYQDLYDSFGMKLLAVCGPHGNDGLQPVDGSLEHVAAKVAKIKHLLLAVEGPNEPEYFWYDGWEYGGFKDRPSQVVWYQNLLYKTLKENAETRDISVTSFAAARVETPYNWYRENKPDISHDIAAYHHYNGTFLPNPYDTLKNVREYYQSEKPFYLTEHGYRIRGDGQVSQKAQMKLNTRSMAFFYDWKDNQKTFFYVAGPDSADGEDYGLANKDFTPRPTYTSMKQLISLVNDSKWNPSLKEWDTVKFTPESLDYSITGEKQDFGWRLIQKCDGDFFLMALPYIDVANRDGSDIENLPRAVTLSFKSKYKVTQYQCTDAGVYQPTSLGAASTSFDVKIPDTLTLFRISPSK